MLHSSLWHRLVLLGAGLLLATAVRSAGAQAGGTRPNLLLIVTDDQGWPEVGLHGNPALETPNLDGLALSGTRLERFYASPVCTPTRAALMTGRYPQRTGAIDTYMGRDTLSAGETTLAQVLKRAGYRTGHIGKWHLGRYRRYHPNLRGFDRFFGFWQYGFINRYFDSPELWEDDRPVTTAGYVTDVLTDDAIRFATAPRPEPFFLYLAYNAPHSPNQAPDALVEKYLKKGLSLRDAQIYGMIDSVDRNVGRLLKSLEETGRAKETLVLFTTDNGYVSGHWGGGLRGKKGSVFEGGIRVPLFARWPGRIPSGKSVDVPAQHIDVFPTLCEAAGVPVPPELKLDGRSVLSLLRKGEGEPPHRFLFHQWTRVRPSDTENWAVHEGRYKLANGMLFDLQTDPGETTDLAGRYPERVKSLREAFAAWFRDVTAGQTYERVPIELGRPDENPVELDLTWADPRGSVAPNYRHYNRDFTSGWTAVGDALEWRVQVTRPGEYAVELTYGCDPADAGSRYEISCGSGKRELTVKPGGRPDVYVRHDIGSLTLRPGAATFSIRALSLTGRRLMELHKVRVRRVDAPAGPTAGSAAGSEARSSVVARRYAGTDG